MNCPSCQSDWLTTQLQNGAIVTKCGACGCIVPAMPSAGAPPAREEARSLPSQAAPQSREKKQDSVSAPVNPLPALRRRRKWVVSEIKRLRKLEAELASIDRILSAASGKPVAVVRELRASRG